MIILVVFVCLFPWVELGTIKKYFHSGTCEYWGNNVCDVNVGLREREEGKKYKFIYIGTGCIIGIVTSCSLTKCCLYIAGKRKKM